MEFSYGISKKQPQKLAQKCFKSNSELKQVEVTPGGPFLMRILHQKYVRIFSFIMPDRLWRFHMELVKNNQKKTSPKKF